MKLYPIKYFVLLVILSSVTTFCLSQNVDKLRSERESLLKEIENTNKLLQNKKSSREAAFQQVNILTKEISIREKLISNLSIEIEALESRIEVNQAVINGLEADIKEGKEEYGKLLRDSYKRRNSLDELVFFLSSTGFSNAYSRYRLLKEYSRYRKNHVQILIENQIRLKAYLIEVQSQMEQKEVSLKNLENEFSSLNDNNNQKRKLITELKKDEKWLLALLKEKEKKAKELESRILEIIRAARTSTSGTSVTGNDITKFMGKLIWPVNKGIIVSQFGEHEHPVLKNILVKNNGIDIQTTGVEEVFAVHSGEISRVISIPGYNNAVIMRHGKFLTVYANLKEIRVKQNQKVNAGVVLGTVFREKNDAGGLLHFEIWNESQKLDPAKWLIP